MTTERILFTVGIVLACAIPTSNASFAAEKKTKKRPNILWIMMDDCRADALGCYGQPWAKTPNMDTIAGRGVRFDVAIVQNPVCVPSRSSMDTAQYPHTLGIMAMGRPAEVPPSYLPKQRKKYPSLLKQWNTVGIQPVNVGKIHAYRQDWASRGDVPPNINHAGKARSPELQKKMDAFAAKNPYPAVMTKTHNWQIGGVIPIKPEESRPWKLGDKAVAALEELAAADEPFFLRVSFHAPHVACSVPPEYMIDPATIKLPIPTQKELDSKPRFERDPLRVYAGGLDLTKKQIGTARGTYYGMVWLVDTQVGRLLDVLRKSGKLDETIIAINSDQGFQLGEHGLWKKRVLYEQNVRVPFVLSCPKLLPEGKVIDEPVELIDFLPTLLELSKIDVPEGIAGRSLLPLIRGEVKTWHEACFSDIDHAKSMYKELRGTGRRVMVRTKKWKLIFFMDPRAKERDGALYNLETDPGETVNLYGDPKYRDVVSRLEKMADRWAKERPGAKKSAWSLKNWPSVQVGMTRKKVLQLLGKPTAKRGPARVEHEGDSEPTIAAAAGIGMMLTGDPRESWEYVNPHAAERQPITEEGKALWKKASEGKKLSEEEAQILVGILALESVFRKPSDESYVVFFDSEGNVEELRPPGTKPQRGSNRR